MRNISLLVLTILLLFTSAYAEMLSLEEAAGATEVLQMEDLENAIDAIPLEERQWTYPISYELLLSSDYIVLANKDSLLAEDYIPDDLVNLKCRKISSDPIQMRAVAAQALEDMFKAAEEDDLYLYAHSGYRSYRTQKTMYYNRLKKNNGKDDGVVQYPGASDHQTGLGIDVINKAGIGKKFTSAFGKTKHGQWLAEHCWEYGFVIRYQQDKEDLTGIAYEPWHLRYVGVQISLYMRDHHLCLEEFTSEWQQAVSEYQF